MPALYDSTSTYDDLALSFDGFSAPLANMPAVGVFVSWDNAPYDAAPAWEEMTPFVRAVTIRRGRQDDLQQFPAGQASVTFDNRSSWFDPMNTATPYNLIPRRQIKIVANWAGVEYPLFRGFISGWPVDYTDAGLDSTVTVDCYDALALLAQEEVQSVPSDSYIATLSPTMFYKCDEPTSVGSQITVRDYSGNGYDMLTSNPSGAPRIPTNGSSLATAVPYTSLNFNNNVVTSRTGSVENGYSTMSVAFWFVNQYNSSGSVSHNMVFAYGTGLIVVGLESSGAVSAVVTTSFGVGFKRTTNATWNWQTGEPHHIAVTFLVGSGTAKIYVDGTEMATSSGGAAFSGSAAIQVGLSSDIFQQVAVFPSELSASQVANIYALAVSRLPESTTVRMNRVLDTTPFPAALRDLTSTPVATVSELGFGDQSVVNELQLVNASENGELYASAEGLLTFLNRNYWAELARCNTSQMTFTSATGAMSYDARGIRYTIDADRIRNLVTVRFTGDGSVVDSDTTSITNNGVAEGSISTQLAASTAATTLADYLVTIYKNPKVAVEPFLVKGQANPSYNWPRLLSLELLDRFTFAFNPPLVDDAGSSWQRDMLAQSIEHRITPGEWETVVNGSTRYTNWFIIGSSLIGGDDLLL